MEEKLKPHPTHILNDRTTCLILYSAERKMISTKFEQLDDILAASEAGESLTSRNRVASVLT